MAPKNKLLVILGPTATGKSDLAVALAKWIEKEKIGGYSGAEIISADSRQVYKGLDIGTGKITKEEMQGIPHYCLDIVEPQERVSVIDWKKSAEAAIAEIGAREKLPIICGGTGFYISALIDELNFPDVETDFAEQKSLEGRHIEELFAELQRLDPRRAKDMENGGDSQNARRLARAILIARELGSVPILNESSKISEIGYGGENSSKYEPLIIGLIMSDEILKERIRARLKKRLDNGMIEEAQKLGLSYERMDELGLEYRYLAKFLQGELTREQLVETLSTKIWQYARRQKTWFKRDKKIEWFAPTDIEKIETLINGKIQAPIK